MCHIFLEIFILRMTIPDYGIFQGVSTSLVCLLTDWRVDEKEEGSLLFAARILEFR